MHPFRYGISLRFEHPEITPEAISEGLGLLPNVRSWKVGDPRTTPKGDPLTGVYRSTYWCAKMAKGEGKDLAAKLETVVADLEHKSEFLRKFCSPAGASN
jgi:hypothetical protein